MPDGVADRAIAFVIGRRASGRALWRRRDSGRRRAPRRLAALSRESRDWRRAGRSVPHVVSPALSSARYSRAARVIPKHQKQRRGLRPARDRIRDGAAAGTTRSLAAGLRPNRHTCTDRSGRSGRPLCRRTGSAQRRSPDWCRLAHRLAIRPPRRLEFDHCCRSSRAAFSITRIDAPAIVTERQSERSVEIARYHRIRSQGDARLRRGL